MRGLHAAFAAWKKRQAEGEDKDQQSMMNALLPGLQQFTPEQLFFISYGNWWCGKSTKAKALERIYTDPHAPKWARILVCLFFFFIFRPYHVHVGKLWCI